MVMHITFVGYIYKYWKYSASRDSKDYVYWDLVPVRLAFNYFISKQFNIGNKESLSFLPIISSYERNLIWKIAALDNNENYKTFHLVASGGEWITPVSISHGQI